MLTGTITLDGNRLPSVEGVVGRRLLTDSFVLRLGKQSSPLSDITSGVRSRGEPRSDMDGPGVGMNREDEREGKKGAKKDSHVGVL